VIRLAALASACVLAGAACGGGSGRIVVRFLEHPDNGGGWKEIIARFEAANPSIDVELVEGPAATNERENQYSLSLGAGDGTYDLAYMDVIWVPKFASRGWLRPLDDRLPPAEREAFLPGDIRGSIVGGRLYRVPMRSDAGMLYYRKDWVNRAPETFEELVTLAKQLHAPPGRYGFVFQGKQYEGLVCDFLEVLWGHGGDVFDESGQVALDRPEAVRALEWLAVAAKTIAPEGVTTYQELESLQVFLDGKVAFMRNWPFAWTKCQAEGSEVRGKVGIVPMVHAAGQKSAATLGGWGFGITTSCRNPDAAWAFIAFATQPEQQKTLHFRNGAIPTRRALFEDADIVKASPHYPELYKALLAARPRPVHPKYAQISDVLQAHVSAALVGRETPEAAVRAAAARIRAVVAE
jgi:multiple sugar transport system substrate-binding protein